MSRNHQRQKTAKTAKAAVTMKVNKAASRRLKTPTPSPDASGDEGYSALENLSDSDDEDERSVQAAEREYIIKEVQSDVRFPDSPRPQGDDEDDGDDEDNGYEEEEDEDDEDDGVEIEGGDDFDDESSWNGIPTSPEAGEVDQFAAMHGELSSPQSQPGRKVVRFANVPDASSDDDTDTDQDAVSEMFPDIFYNVDSLPQNIRRQYERDSPNDDISAFEALDSVLNGLEYSTAESDPEAILRQYDTDTPIATPIAGAPHDMFVLPGVSMPAQAMAQSPELDGYETDGDTTEDDIPAPSPAPLKKTRRLEAGEDDEASDTDQTPIKSSKGQPRVGRFNLDKSGKKPIAVLDPITKRMLIFTPHKRGQLDLSPELFHANFPTFDPLEQSSPMGGTNDSTPMSMNAMFSGNAFGDVDFGSVHLDSFLGNANFDWTKLDSSCYIPVGESFFTEMGRIMGDEGEENLDLGNFIKGGSWADETDGDETDARPSTAGEEGTSDLDILSTPISMDLGLLPQPQQVYSAHNDVFVDLDFDISDILGGQLAASPKRRRRSSAAMPPPSSPIESVLQKRKSVEHHQGPTHKRQRSITTDVAHLTM